MVHIEVGDFSSSDEESITYTKKTKVTTSNTWPRFLIISCHPLPYRKGLLA